MAKKVIAFAGAVQRDARACNDAGIDAIFPDPPRSGNSG